MRWVSGRLLAWVAVLCLAGPVWADTTGLKTASSVVPQSGSAFAAQGGLTLAGAVSAADGEYLMATTGQGSIAVTGFGFSVPAGATVTGVHLRIAHAGGTTNVGQRSEDASIRLGGASPAGLERRNSGFWSGYDTWDYGSSSDLWGWTLTPAVVNDPSFGAFVSCATENGMGISFYDQIQMEVYYTPAPPRQAWSLVDLQGYGSAFAGGWVYAALKDPNANGATFVLWFNNQANPQFGVFQSGNGANWAMPSPSNLDAAWTSAIAADAAVGLQNGEFGSAAASDNAFVGMLLEGVGSAAGFGGSSNLILGALVPSLMYYDRQGGPAFAIGQAGGKWAGTPSSPPATGGNSFSGETNGGPAPLPGQFGVAGAGQQAQAGFGGGTLTMGNGGQAPSGAAGTIGTIGQGGTVAGSGASGSSGTTGTSGVAGTSGSGGSSAWSFLWTWIQDAASEVGGWFYAGLQWLYDRTVGSMLNELKNWFCWLISYCVGYMDDGVAWLGQYFGLVVSQGGYTNDASTAGSGETVKTPNAATILPSDSTGVDGVGGTGKGPNDNSGVRSLWPGTYVGVALAVIAQAATFLRACNCWFAIDAGFAFWMAYYSFVVVLVTYRLVKSWIPTLSG